MARGFGVCAALWLGLVATLALVAAPTLFAMLDRPLAGRLAGQMFRVEAHAALAFGLILLLIERARRRKLMGQGAAPSVDLLLIAGALFCTVLGYFGLQPMMEAAKQGEPTRFSFTALHAASTGFFGLKGLLLLALVWRQAGH